MKKTFLIIIIGLLVAFPAIAKIGVGVGLGKIEIDEPLKSGGIYSFPNLPVLNTGDELTEYAMEVTFFEDQPELKPEADWFSFSPNTFTLEGGESQIVEVKITIPANIISGDYFAFLEAHPIQSAEGVTIGIAAATKTYFTIQAGTILGAFTERVKTFFTTYTPASIVVLSVIVLAIIVITFRRNFSFKFKLERKKNKTSDTEDKK